MTTAISTANRTLYTIGHSNHSMERFLELLRMHEITAVADVRSVPYSKYCPQFDRENLQQFLQRIGCRYVFLGEELGGKRREPECYINGQIDYEKVATLPAFREGCERLLRGVAEYRIALLCAEKDPANCHRTLLVSRALRNRLTILHILADGSTLLHEEVERRITEKSETKLLDKVAP